MFGFGSRNPQMRVVRLGLLAVLLIAGATFHHTGPVYTAIRVAYYAVILGGLGYLLWRRSAAKRQGPAGVPGPQNPGDTHPPTTAGHQPGWFPDHHDMSVQRYWDGTTWTATRRWDGSKWDEGGTAP
jgi:hypothetical protein